MAVTGETLLALKIESGRTPRGSVVSIMQPRDSRSCRFHVTITASVKKMCFEEAQPESFLASVCIEA